jgi:hypothetical protein
MLHRPPPGYDQPGYDQPGYDQPSGPAGYAVNGGYAKDNGPAGPARPGRNRNRNRALVAGAGVLSVIAIGGVILAPKMVHRPDPGCTAYAGPALTAYNKTINDLNAEATQAHLSADMSAAVSEMTKAVDAAHDSTVKSALSVLLIQLKKVQADVAGGTLPASTVNALNAASTTADHAC